MIDGANHSTYNSLWHSTIFHKKKFFFDVNVLVTERIENVKRAREGKKIKVDSYFIFLQKKLASNTTWRQAWFLKLLKDELCLARKISDVKKPKYLWEFKRTSSCCFEWQKKLSCLWIQLFLMFVYFYNGSKMGSYPPMIEFILIFFGY